MKFLLFLIIGVVQLNSFAQIQHLQVDTLFQCNDIIELQCVDCDTLVYEEHGIIVIVKDSKIRRVSKFDTYNYSSLVIRNFTYQNDTLVYFHRQHFKDPRIEKLGNSVSDKKTIITLLNEEELVCTKTAKYISNNEVIFSILTHTSSDPYDTIQYKLIETDTESLQHEFTLIKEAEGVFYSYFAECLVANKPVVLNFGHFSGFYAQPEIKIREFKSREHLKQTFVKAHPKEALILESLYTQRNFNALIDSCIAMKKRIRHSEFLLGYHTAGLSMKQLQINQIETLERLDYLVQQGEYYRASIECFELICREPNFIKAKIKLDTIIHSLKNKSTFPQRSKIEDLLEQSNFYESMNICDSLQALNYTDDYLKFLKYKSTKLCHAQLILNLGNFYYDQNKLWVSDRIYETYLEKYFPNDSVVIAKQDEIMEIWLAGNTN